MPHTTDLSLKSLYLVPGLASDFEAKLQAAVRDVRERPALSKARKVKIELEVCPDPEDADDMLIKPVITATTPARSLQPLRARSNARNQLQFDFSEEEI